MPRPMSDRGGRVQNEKIVREKETETVYPRRLLGEPDSTEKEESAEEVPGAEDFAQMISALGSAPLKAQIFKVQPTGADAWCGTISSDDVDLAAPQEAIRAKWGPGKFKVKYPSDDGRVGVINLDIISPAETTNPQNPWINIVSPGSGQPPVQVDGSNPTTALMLATTNALFQMMADERKATTQLLGKLVEREQHAPSPSSAIAGMSLKEFFELQRLMKDDGGEKFQRWVDIGLKFADKIGGIIAPVPDSPWLYFMQQVLPNLKDLLKDFGATMVRRPPMGLPVAGVPAPAPTVAGAVPMNYQAPGQPPQSAPTVSANDVDPRIVEQVKPMFEQLYLPKLLEAAAEDVIDPYALTWNFKAQLGGDTRNFFKFIGLTDAEGFYQTYPAARNYRDWFDEFFYYIANPSLKPPVEEEETEEAEEELEGVIEVKPNGGGSRRVKQKPRRNKGNGAAANVVGVPASSPTENS